MMNIRSDIAVYDNTGNLILVVEIKNKLRTDNEWAAKMRRNMLAHGLLPNAPFFLLALPDRFYLWTDGQLVPEIEKPDYETDPAAILKSYYEKTGTNLPNLSSASFELLVTAWLWELVRGNDLSYEANDWLVDSGLLEAIRQGNVVSEAVR